MLINKAATIERGVFALLADGLKRMVGFRNIAVPGGQALQLPITVKHLDEFLDYSRALLLRDAVQPRDSA
ncbi:MAG: hypothetical protein ABJA84_04590 [Polaromonas sp.]